MAPHARAGSEAIEVRDPGAPKIDYKKANAWRAEHGLPLWTNVPGGDDDGAAAEDPDARE